MAEAGPAAATRAGDDVARTAMLISRGQALWSVGRDEEALADCLAGERLAAVTGWTTAEAYLSHHVAWLYPAQGRLADAEERLHRALELTEDDRLSHVRAVALNGLGVMRLCRGELWEAAELLTDVLAAYRKGQHLRGELSTLDEWSELHRQRGDAVTALKVARQAHDMAIMVRDRKITAQVSATVAQAHLALGDTTAAVQWFEDCLAIAHDTYPFIEARALVGLAPPNSPPATPTSVAAMQAAK